MTDVELQDGIRANVSMMIDEDGKPYALVHIEGLTARHYPQKFGLPRGGDLSQASNACIFLEGEPCFLV